MRWFAIAFASLTMLVGCASTPPPRYYTLSIEAPQTASAQGPSISVAAVTVPDTVDRPQLVVAVNANEVIILEQQRWAEPLKGELGRVLAENLSRATGNPRIAAYPQSASLNADYRLLVDFQRFAGRPGGDVVLDVLWGVRAKDGALVRRGRSSAREAVDKGYDALVVAYSRALATLAGEIATALKDLPAAK
jgi:uncharacterized protein